jgi:hypothetical protein
VEVHVAKACRDVLAKAKLGYDIHFVHETAPHRLIAMQILGSAIGFAFYNKKAHLSVHEDYGPWFAYRAAIFIDATPLDTSVVSNPPLNPCPSAAPAVKAALGHVWEAIHKEQGAERMQDDDVQYHGRRGDWRSWIALRDSIGVGNEEWRYSAPQLVYHYTTDRKILAQMCDWRPIDILVIGTDPPCPRCGLLLEMMDELVQILGLEDRSRVRHIAWDSPLGQGLCNDGGEFHDIGTAHQVAKDLNIEADWKHIQQHASDNDVPMLDESLRLVEAAAKNNAWLMTPILIVNGKVYWHGSMPNMERVKSQLKREAQKMDFAV